MPEGLGISHCRAKLVHAASVSADRRQQQYRQYGEVQGYEQHRESGKPA